MVYNFLIKETSTTCANKFTCIGIKNENMSDQQLAKELQKPFINKFKKRKVQSPFIDNIWDAELSDIWLISTFNKGIRFLCLIDIFSKYAWVIPLKDRKGITITNAFQKVLDESNHKTNKIWIYQGRKVYNRSMKSWLEKNAIQMHSTHSEGKSIVAERSIRTLKNKSYNCMTSISKNVYIDKWDDIVYKYNNTYNSTIKLKLVDVKSSTYIDSSNKINVEDPKFKIGDIVTIWKCKNIFAKCYVLNWSEEGFVITKVKNIVSWTYVISDLKN